MVCVCACAQKELSTVSLREVGIDIHILQIDGRTVVVCLLYVYPTFLLSCWKRYIIQSYTVSIHERFL